MATDEIPTEALQAAARAAYAGRYVWPDTVERVIAAAAPYLIAEGRRQAAEAIRAHADRFAPDDDSLTVRGRIDRQRLRRHLAIAERLALPPIDQADVIAELEAIARQHGWDGT